MKAMHAPGRLACEDHLQGVYGFYSVTLFVGLVPQTHRSLCSQCCVRCMLLAVGPCDLACHHQELLHLLLSLLPGGRKTTHAHITGYRHSTVVAAQHPGHVLATSLCGCHILKLVVRQAVACHTCNRPYGHTSSDLLLEAAQGTCPKRAYCLAVTTM